MSKMTQVWRGYGPGFAGFLPVNGRNGSGGMLIARDRRLRAQALEARLRAQEVIAKSQQAVQTTMRAMRWRSSGRNGLQVRKTSGEQKRKPSGSEFTVGTSNRHRR